MHLRNPVPQTVENQALHNGMIGLESITRSGVVCILGFIFLQDVVEAVFKPTEAECRPILVALTSVVVNNVQDYFNAGSMQFLHHGSKLVQTDEWIVAGAVTDMGSKERHGPIAPVVLESGCGVLNIELEHWQEFDGCDPEILEIRDLFDESEIRSFLGLGNAGVRVAGKPGHVHFVNHCRAK